MTRLPFQIEGLAEDSQARAGRLRTGHGEIATPIFMPVGTHATVRGQRLESLAAMGFPCLLANTYHLLLRPGPEVFRQLGGIRPFMNWKGAVLTDSGGFQIFSLPNQRQISEAGAEFFSYADCQRHLLSPERSIEMQKAIGSDIMMVLDHCVPSTVSRELAAEAMHRTYRWALRSLEARGDSPAALFGIVQGACFEDLRRESARLVTGSPFDGFAIGGLAVGKSKEERERMTALTTLELPADRPRYLMGVGTPLDILEAVHRGVDMFDCILPTALAGKGVAFTSRGKLSLRRGVYRLDEEPLDRQCGCSVCSGYSRAYLHHLVKVGECLGWQLLAEHNLYFYRTLMNDIRAAILDGTFAAFYGERREWLGLSEADAPVRPPRRSPRRGPSPRLGQYELCETGTGALSVRHLPSGEVMHSVNDPEEEARRLYLEQSGLLERLHGESPLVIWDVGLGAAVNAMTTIRAVEKAAGTEHQGTASAAVEIWSFENDLDSLRLAIRHAARLRHMQHPAPHRLLETGEWSSPATALRWRLMEGDFRETLERAPVPNLIYFDPFSFKTDSALWTLTCFRRIFAHCEGHATELFTYSNSTGVRAALLGAGFFVAKGLGSGPKTETTIALTPLALAIRRDRPLLPLQWLERWERSHARYPRDLAVEERPRFETIIRGHQQFQGAPA